MAKIRITGGANRGFIIDVPAGARVRPTPSMAREAIFNILAPAIQDAVVLEFFAGAGTLGLEALSRGASHAIFVEVSAKHAELITRNVARLRAGARATVIGADAYHSLTRVEAVGLAADIVFLDPPYDETRSLSPGTKIAAFVARCEGIEEWDVELAHVLGRHHEVAIKCLAIHAGSR